MPITVQELAAMSHLGLTVVAGRAGVDRDIQWAHPIELVDPTPWIQGSELLLTTGISLSTSRSDLREYIFRLADAGVAALAFGVGLSHDAVPAAMIEAGDERGFPILQVPLPTAFIAVTKAVAERQQRDRENRLRHIVEVQQAMTRHALSNGAQGVVALVAQTLACEAIVVDLLGETLAAQAPDAALLARQVGEAVTATRGATAPFSIGSAVGTTHLVVQSLGVGSTIRGYLGVSRGPAITQEDRLILAQANSLISLELEKPSDVIEAERRLRADMLRAMLNGTLRDAAISRQLAEVGWSPQPEVTVSLVVSSATPVDRLASVHAVFEELNTPYLACTIGVDVAVLCPSDGPSAADLQDRLRRHARRRPFVGRSRSHVVAKLKDAHRQARFAAYAARAEDSGSREFAQLSTYSLLLASQDPDALATIAEAALEPLIRSDETFRGQLLLSLEAFLSNNAQWVPAANALGVHRHTLRNRIRRVEEITGRNLSSAHDRTELWLALKAHELSQITLPVPSGEGHEPADL